MSRDIGELLKKPGSKLTEKVSAEEYTRQAYLEDVARVRDFTPDRDKMFWPNPIGPKWKN